MKWYHSSLQNCFSRFESWRSCQMEKIGNPEMDERKRIRFLNVANEGSKWFSFVICPTSSSIVIPYAWLDNISEVTHTQLFDLAVEEFGFNERFEPIAGGVFNAKTCELHDSIHYGGIDNPTIEKAVRHKAHCESF